MTHCPKCGHKLAPTVRSSAELGLTTRQHDLLKFLEWFIPRNGYSPSFDEMVEGTRLKSKSGISRLIGGLEERGYIRRKRFRARSVELV